MLPNTTLVFHIFGLFGIHSQNSVVCSLYPFRNWRGV